MAAREQIALSSGWRVTRHTPSDPEARWINVKKVPTVIHLDLMALENDHPEKIADPFVDLNEFDARWVADARWTYECRFPSPDFITEGRIDKGKSPVTDYVYQEHKQGTGSGSDPEKGPATIKKKRRTIDLVFKGLDTITTVSLNGSHLLDTNNMFVEYTAEVTDRLRTDGDENVLLIRFDPARLVGLDKVSKGVRHEYHVHQTEVGRAAIRKAQFQWGWDWGPVLNTAGPWKPVVLDSYEACIEPIPIWTHLSDDLASGRAILNVAILGNPPRTFLNAEIYSPSGDKVFDVSKRIEADQQESRVNFTFDFDHPELWWPAGYGQRSMYTVQLALHQLTGGPTTNETPDALAENISADSKPWEEHRKSRPDTPPLAWKTLDTLTTKFAFRRSKLVQTKDSFGTSFYFQINNVDIFAGGSCWIPPDSFLQKPNYDQWMSMLLDSNQTMVRVWGGGVYESDAFYDACDEHGILVWQDFAFACASYPANDIEFLHSVEVEARQNVARLQRHPSLVIWAGNNEDYQIKEHYNLQYDPAAAEPRDWLKTKFPARFIYEHILPKIVLEGYGVSEGGQAVPYHPGSPYGDARSTTLRADPTIGDIHQWNVWHGAMKPYQEYPSLGGRFVSEFGMQAHPCFDTICHTITTKLEFNGFDQIWPGSVTMDVRNKATGHQHRLLKYVAENFRVHELDNPLTFGHLTQIMQADAVGHAFKGWRRLWKDRQCGGALVWQLNDCWPTISWSVVDYYRVPKPAFYAMKRALAPLAIAVQRKFVDWTTRRAGDGWQRDTGHVEPQLSSLVQYSVWVASSKLEPERGCHTVVRFISIATGKDVSPKIEIQHTVMPNTSNALIVDDRVLSEEQAHGLLGEEGSGAAGPSQSNQEPRPSMIKDAWDRTWDNWDPENLQRRRKKAKPALKEEIYEPESSDDSIAVHLPSPDANHQYHPSQPYKRYYPQTTPMDSRNPFAPLSGYDPVPYRQYGTNTGYQSSAGQYGQAPLHYSFPSYDFEATSSSSLYELDELDELDVIDVLDVLDERVKANIKAPKDGVRSHKPTDFSNLGHSTELLRSLAPCVIFATLYDAESFPLSTDTSWPDPIKHLKFPDRRVTVNTSTLLENTMTGSVSVRADKPVKGFVFDEEVGGITFSDNGFDIMPGEVQLVFVTKKTAEERWPDFKYRYVGHDIWKDNAKVSARRNT